MGTNLRLGDKTQDLIKSLKNHLKGDEEEEEKEDAVAQRVRRVPKFPSPEREKDQTVSLSPRTLSLTAATLKT